MRRKNNWILLRDVLEHIRDDDLVLRNVSESTMDGGYLMMSVPRKIPFFNFWDPAWVRWKLGGKERHKHYSKKEILEKMEQNGFRVVSIHLEGNIRWLLFRWLNILIRYLPGVGQIENPWSEGHFDWVVLSRKKKFGGRKG